MKKSQVQKAELVELIAAYSEAARTQGAATETGDYKTGNKASDLLAAIYSELRRRGREASARYFPCSVTMILGSGFGPHPTHWSSRRLMENGFLRH